MNPVAARHQVGMLLDSIGMDSYDSRIAKDRWKIRSGTANGEISLLVNDDDPRASVITVQYKVMKLPLTAVLPFYRRLLEVNHSFMGTRVFSVDESNVVWLSAGRTLRDMDPSEIRELVTETSKYADHYDDVLLDEFGRECALDTPTA